mgnify:CR=1 FL=1
MLNQKDPDVIVTTEPMLTKSEEGEVDKVTSAESVNLDKIEGKGLTLGDNVVYFEYDKYTAESLRHLLPILIGKDPLNREEILYDIRPRVFPQPPGAQALIDNALWDILGKKCKKQYKLKRNKNMQELIAPDASWLD